MPKPTALDRYMLRETYDVRTPEDLMLESDAHAEIEKLRADSRELAAMKEGGVDGYRLCAGEILGDMDVIRSQSDPHIAYLLTEALLDRLRSITGIADPLPSEGRDDGE